MPPYVLSAPSPLSVLVPLHGIASRHDLPLPFPFVLIGAGAALVVSFVVLGVAWRHPRFTTVGGVALPRLTRVVDAPAFRTVARAVVLLLFAWVALALFAGLAWLGAWLRRAPAPAPAGAETEGQQEPRPWTERARETLVAVRTWKTLRWLLLIEVANLLVDVFTGFLALYMVDVVHLPPAVAALAIAIRLGAPAYPYDTLTFSGEVTTVEDGVATIAVVGRVSLGDHVTGTVRVSVVPA